eukprot:gnl/TRDRNA2_/TRDRNA2_30791_c0_seq1.p1 gnl/TRDRNA2_/TRDRNA2_30791_c0~~gnl/TRDRNA2_/TRDRNA2_30791_c0_seq1.p1  ORF type:complete len:494 (+),score=69.21 gnl/TRDRNA2_/TRDRNA2_30791_c0_seq1:74-1555(+)
MWTGCLFGMLFRYLLYVAGAPAYLEEHLEFSSPMTSHSQLKEGMFLLDGGSSPYAGSVVRQPPLVLYLLFPLRHAPPFVHFLLVAAVDVLTALLLRHIAAQYAVAKSRASQVLMEASVRQSKDTSVNTSSALEDVVSPDFVGLSYLWNPFTIAGCLAQSLQNVHHLMICSALCLAGSGRGGLAAGALALTLYVCPFTPLVLILPCAYLSFVERDVNSGAGAKQDCTYRHSVDETVVEWPFAAYLVRFVIAVLLLLACLFGSSIALMDGQLQFLQACYLSVLSVQDLTPNVGIFWYIFIEIFDRYRSLFLVAFHAHLLFYPVPLHVRIGRHRPTGPWIHCVAAVGIVTIFKPYPTASDYGLMLSTMLIHAELIRESDTSFAFLLSGLLFGLAMFPTMAAVWLGRNAGNANYVYNMTLVINIFASLLLTEWLKAGMKLRRRQHIASFCRGVVLSTLDEMLASRGPPARPKTPMVKEGQAGGVDETAQSGLRHRAR